MTTSGHRYDDRDQPDRDEHEREAEQLVRLLRPRLLGDAQSSHSWASRQRYWLNELPASSAATAVAAVITVASLVAALLVNSASKVLTGFEALSSGVTLVMIFVVQHTQSRQQAAVQRKLDVRGAVKQHAPAGLDAQLLCERSHSTQTSCREVLMPLPGPRQSARAFPRVGFAWPAP